MLNIFLSFFFLWHITIFVNENSQDRTNTALANASKTMLGEIRIEQNSALFLKRACLNPPPPSTEWKWSAYAGEKMHMVFNSHRCHFWSTWHTTCETRRLLFGSPHSGNYREKITGWYQVSKSSSQRANHKTITKKKCILLQWQLSSQIYPVQSCGDSH